MLILGGISGAGMVTFLQEYRPIFMAVTFGFLGSAFYLTYRPRRGGTAGNDDNKRAAAKAASPASRIMKLNRIMLWVVTSIVIAFLLFPQTFARRSSPGEEITAEMQQSVIAIEGMT